VGLFPDETSGWRSCHGFRAFYGQADKPFCPLLVTDGTLAAGWKANEFRPMRADVRALAFGAYRKTGIDFCGIRAVGITCWFCAPERRAKS
jgi:hypothetical protein